MAGPFTVNSGFIVADTGSLVDTWGSAALNPDFVSLDGMIAGVQIIGATNIPITLTSPAGFVATPSPGPTQAQNRVLRFTGVLTGNVRVTLPLPGSYLVDNRTTGAFVLSFQGVTATEVVAIDQGNIVEIYNDGANVRFVNLGKVGDLEFWAGISAIPAWVAACTVKPYLLCDATVFNASDFPYLANKFGGLFGGNGSTTSAPPDLRGRVPLSYDGTGTRITVAGCGINGQQLGASLDRQFNTLAANQIPTITSTNAAQAIALTGTASTPSIGTSNDVIGSGGNGPRNWMFSAGGSATVTVSGNVSISTTYTNSAQQNVPNVQPAQVAGIWVAKT